MTMDTNWENNWLPSILGILVLIKELPPYIIWTYPVSIALEKQTQELNNSSTMMQYIVCKNSQEHCLQFFFFFLL